MHQCSAGRLAALSGFACQYQPKNLTAAYMDCCQMCQIALAVKSFNISCNDSFFSYFFNIASYQLCCLSVDGGHGTSNPITTLNENIYKNNIIANDRYDINTHDLKSLSNGSITLHGDDGMLIITNNQTRSVYIVN